MGSFDTNYAMLWDSFQLQALHFLPPIEPFSAHKLHPKLHQISFNSAFTALCSPPTDRLYVIIPLDEGIVFNLTPLSVGSVGFASHEMPGLLRFSHWRACRVLFVQLDGYNQHYRLLSSPGMPLYLPRFKVNQDLTASDCDSFIFELKLELRKALPPMRPINLLGRSRIARKNLIRDVVMSICHDLDSQQAVESAARHYSVSERTVRNAFIDVMGMSAKQFMLKQQLFGYRQRLACSKDKSVQEISQSLKISSQGRMAAKYKALFDENPNETFRRNRHPS